MKVNDIKNKGTVSHSLVPLFRHFLQARAEIIKKVGLLFRRIQAKKNCYWDLLTSNARHLYQHATPQMKNLNQENLKNLNCGSCLRFALKIAFPIRSKFCAIQQANCKQPPLDFPEVRFFIKFKVFWATKFEKKNHPLKVDKQMNAKSDWVIFF